MPWRHSKGVFGEFYRFMVIQDPRWESGVGCLGEGPGRPKDSEKWLPQANHVPGLFAAADQPDKAHFWVEGMRAVELRFCTYALGCVDLSRSSKKFMSTKRGLLSF